MPRAGRGLTQVRLGNGKESVCSGRVFRSRFEGSGLAPLPLGLFWFESDRRCEMGKMKKVNKREARAVRKGRAFEDCGTRVDTGSKSFDEQMERVFREIPAEGKRVKTNFARILQEDRE